MNKLLAFSAFLLLFSTVGCSKRFGPLYQDAQDHFAQGKWIEAIDKINLALPFWKDDDGAQNKAQAYQLLGKAYHELKKIDKASEAYLKAIQLSTNTFDSALALGTIYTAASKPEQAANAYSMALSMKKDDPRALLGLGNARYVLGELDQAQSVYERIIDVSPGVNEALEYLEFIREKKRGKKTTLALPRRPARGTLKTH